MSIHQENRIITEQIRERQVINQLQLLDKSPGSINNIISGFKQMIKSGILTSPLSKAQFYPPQYNKLKRNISTHIKQTGKNRQWASFINDVQFAVLSSSEISMASATFTEALITLLTDTFGTGVSRSALSRALKEDKHDFKDSPIYHWLEGTKVPKNTVNDIASVKRLDDLTGAEGLLIRKHRQFYPYQYSGIRKEKLAADNVNAEKLFAQNLAFIQWKLKAITPRHIPEQLKSITTHELIRIKPRSKKLWTVNTKGRCTASNGRIGSLTRLAKSYRMYNDKIPIENVLFHDFLDIHFIDFHISLCKESNIIKAAITDCLNLMRACRNASFESFYYIPENLPWATWEQDLKTLEVYTRSKADELVSIQETLDGSRHIRFIINSSTPDEKVDAISQFLYEAHFTHTKLGPKASALTMSFVWELCRTCPLRAGNLTNLRWLGELGDNEISSFETTKPIGLYKNKLDGHYYIYVHVSHLKNRRVNGIVSIHQNISYMDHVTDKLLDTNRQYLKEIGHESVDYLIFSVVQEPTPMPETSFSKRFKNNTYTATCYLFPEINSEGINPHAMRHLSATLYLRDNPKDYIAVSTMLMDTLETVIRVYAKIDNRKNSESIHTWMVDKLAGRGV